MELEVGRSVDDLPLFCNDIAEGVVAKTFTPEQYLAVDALDFLLREPEARFDEALKERQVHRDFFAFEHSIQNARNLSETGQGKAQGDDLFI